MLPIEFLNQIQRIASMLDPAVERQLMTLGAQMATALANPAAYQAAFRELWAFALTQVRNINLLRLLQPMLRPGLGLLGGAWGEVEMCSMILFSATVSEVIGTIALVILGIILACLFLLLIIWLVKSLLDAMGWIPAQQPQPMQTPHWNNLLNAVSTGPYGPVYCLHMRALPAGIG